MVAGWTSDEYWNRAPSARRAYDECVAEYGDQTIREVTKAGLNITVAIGAGSASVAEAVQSNPNVLSSVGLAALAFSSLYRLGGRILERRDPSLTIERMQQEAVLGNLEHITNFEEGEIDG